MRFIPDPLTVICDSCGKTAETFNSLDPDSALDCDCCPVRHNHAGLGCRTITVRAKAHLTIFSINDIMEALGTEDLPEVSIEEVLS